MVSMRPVDGIPGLAGPPVVVHALVGLAGELAPGLSPVLELLLLHAAASATAT